MCPSRLAMKTCFKCGQSKPLSEYYRHAGMSDGYLNKCKECAKRDAWKNRQDNLEHYREYDRSRAKLPKRISASQSITAEYRKRYPERYRANNLVSSALKGGKLTKLNCWVCGAGKVEAHHPDYSRPLEVVWLCPEHHKEIHLAYPEEFYDHPTIRTALPEWHPSAG